MSRPGAGIDPLEKSLRALEAKARKLLIRELRFPNYRNFEANERLIFAFPVTAILGCNGTNKSSLLHALYGSLKDRSVADFWFETRLDAIPEVRDGLKQSVTHTYESDDGTLVECIKARAPRGEADPDYWEAVKPTRPYGFAPSQPRVPPLQAKVVHLDFRAELPAFDKYFYFPDPQHLTGLVKRAKETGRLRREYRKQDYLRRKSVLVKRALDERGTDLTDEELSTLSYILGRTYQAGRLLRHSLYHGHDGRTIRFTVETIDGGYSDAFAGSGESAAAFLVHDVLEAPQGSLVLLDEPETSLHPKAQQRALEFICHHAVRKSLQVVMATHSTYLTEALPQSAIRVLYMNSRGRVSVSSEHSVREALHEVADLPHGKVVLVEDDRARHIVVSALKAWGGLQALQEIRVIERPGGTSRIFLDIQAHAWTEKRDLFVVLDGDHRPIHSLPPADKLPQGQAELEAIVNDYIKGPNAAGQSLTFVNSEEVTAYIVFLRTRVHFLPGTTPEALVWSQRYLENKLGSVPKAALDEKDGKRRLQLVADAHAGMDAEAIFKMLVAELIRGKSDERNTLESIVTGLRQEPM
jgi:AAA domain, putative AbiEii toxin, Type IV TA system